MLVRYLEFTRQVRWRPASLCWHDNNECLPAVRLEVLIRLIVHDCCSVRRQRVQVFMPGTLRPMWVTFWVLGL